MTEHTAFECDLTGRRAQNKNVVEELVVVEASDKWKCPNEYTYHVHIEELMDLENKEEIERPEFDDEDTRIFVDNFCYEDGKVVGAIAQESQTIGRAVDRNRRIFVDRDDLTAYYELMATLIEDELHHDR